MIDEEDNEGLDALTIYEAAKRWKDDVRVEAYGSVDELNSEIGLCRELLKEQKSDQFSSLIFLLKSIQNELFNLGSQLAVSVDAITLPKLSNDATIILESEIDKANESLLELTSFVLPGGSVLNAQFHRARNVCRRTERRIISLAKDETVKQENIQYLNRLSDALFVWSRLISRILGDPENLWEPNN